MVFLEMQPDVLKALVGETAVRALTNFAAIVSHVVRETGLIAKARVAAGASERQFCQLIIAEPSSTKAPLVTLSTQPRPCHFLP